MKCWIEIYQDRGLIYKERIWLWYVKDRSWELNAKSRERQLNFKIACLVKALPVIDLDRIQIIIMFKSKMNNDHSNWVLKGSVDNSGGDNAHIAGSVL
jgi:hypothetical protein